MRERGARAREPIIVQAAKVDAFLEVHLRVAGRLQRPIPAMLRIDVVGSDDRGLVCLFLRHVAYHPLFFRGRFLVIAQVDVF